jgi:spermidine synthase
MSDTEMERVTNLDFIRSAFGDVLIGGLGIGMLPAALLSGNFPRRIESITVIEQSPDVIALVEPYLRDPRLHIVEGDVFTWNARRHPIRMFDSIYFDIWPDICPDYAPDMARLHRRYRRLLDNRPCGDMRPFITSWLFDYMSRKMRLGRHHKRMVQDAVETSRRLANALSMEEAKSWHSEATDSPRTSSGI